MEKMKISEDGIVIIPIAHIPKYAQQTSSEISTMASSFLAIEWNARSPNMRQNGNLEHGLSPTIILVRRRSTVRKTTYGAYFSCLPTFPSSLRLFTYNCMDATKQKPKTITNVRKTHIKTLFVHSDTWTKVYKNLLPKRPERRLKCRFFFFLCFFLFLYVFFAFSLPFVLSFIVSKP